MPKPKKSSADRLSSKSHGSSVSAGMESGSVVQSEEMKRHMGEAIRLLNIAIGELKLHFDLGWKYNYAMIVHPLITHVRRLENENEKLRQDLRNAKDATCDSTDGGWFKPVRLPSNVGVDYAKPDKQSDHVNPDGSSVVPDLPA